MVKTYFIRYLTSEKKDGLCCTLGDEIKATSQIYILIRQKYDTA